MGHSQAEKVQNRERILAEASRQVRRDGLESVSVGTLMKSVGLTHGGFYGHFESRSALLAEALKRALLDGEESNASAQGAAGPQSLSAIARSYLSRTHRDARESGCAMTALVSDVGRADTSSREVMTEHIERFVASVSDALGGDQDRALVAVSAMVGALALSRVITDPARSDAFLKSVRDHLTALDAAS
ncbi:TetR/AcrR family transcriptional regulator [Phenylobacterium sp.]|uniref:TetR/AcrR family transcriptional regulator n=1 Tax=Phenylobacterium sp. TaxID=1871053 RepID=UPI0035630732